MVFFNHCPLRALRQGDWKPPFRQRLHRLCSQGSLIQCRWSVALGQKLRSLSETDATQRASAGDGALGRGSVFLLAAPAARTVPCSLAGAEGDVPQPPQQWGRLRGSICESSTAAGNTSSAANLLLALRRSCPCQALGQRDGEREAPCWADVPAFFSINGKIDRFLLWKPCFYKKGKLSWI